MKKKVIRFLDMVVKGFLALLGLSFMGLIVMTVTSRILPMPLWCSVVITLCILYGIVRLFQCMSDYDY